MRPGGVTRLPCLGQQASASHVTCLSPFISPLCLRTRAQHIFTSDVGTRRRVTINVTWVQGTRERDLQGQVGVVPALHSTLHPYRGLSQIEDLDLTTILGGNLSRVNEPVPLGSGKLFLSSGVHSEPASSLHLLKGD